jgi:hypothetical protein
MKARSAFLWFLWLLMLAVPLFICLLGALAWTNSLLDWVGLAAMAYIFWDLGKLPPPWGFK